MWDSVKRFFVNPFHPNSWFGKLFSFTPSSPQKQKAEQKEELQVIHKQSISLISPQNDGDNDEIDDCISSLSASSSTTVLNVNDLNLSSASTSESGGIKEVRSTKLQTVSQRLQQL